MEQSIIQSIYNVRLLINNSLLMLRDLDSALSKKGFQPINGNALGTETSKSIYQSMNQYATLFPQYISRQYALETEIDEKKITKSIYVNIQFYHGDYEELEPSLTCSVIYYQELIEDLKEYVYNNWLKYMIYEELGWDNVKKNGEFNELLDEEGDKTVFWCRNLLEIDGQEKLQREVDQLLSLFFND